MNVSRGMRRYTTSHHQGFSLVELLVSVAIFTIVMTIAAGALVTLLSANLKARTVKVATNNLNVALESMSRSVFSAVSEYMITGGGSALSFTADVDGVAYDIEFRLATVGGRGEIQRRMNGGDWVPVTSSDVNVTSLTFTKTGTGMHVENILIAITALVGDPSDPATLTPITAQTTVSQALEIPTISAPPATVFNPLCILTPTGADLFIDMESSRFSTTTMSQANFVFITSSASPPCNNDNFLFLPKNACTSPPTDQYLVTRASDGTPAGLSAGVAYQVQIQSFDEHVYWRDFNSNNLVDNPTSSDKNVNEVHNGHKNGNCDPNAPGGPFKNPYGASIAGGGIYGTQRYEVFHLQYYLGGTWRILSSATDDVPDDGTCGVITTMTITPTENIPAGTPIRVRAGDPAFDDFGYSQPVRRGNSVTPVCAVFSTGAGGGSVQPWRPGRRP